MWIKYVTVFISTDKFFMIDVRDLKTGRFMEYIEAQEFLIELEVDGIHYMPPLAAGKVSVRKIETILMDEPSMYYPGEKEGLVIKRYHTDPQQRIKLYHPLHSEREGSDSGDLDYLTVPRFRKAIMRLVEEHGKKPVRFEEVVKEVIRDVHIEEQHFL